MNAVENLTRIADQLERVYNTMREHGERNLDAYLRESAKYGLEPLYTDPHEMLTNGRSPLLDTLIALTETRIALANAHREPPRS